MRCEASKQRPLYPCQKTVLCLTSFISCIKIFHDIILNNSNGITELYYGSLIWYCQKFYEKQGKNMKPQSRNLSGSQSSTLSSDETRDALCSPTEYLLMEITEELYPVYSIVGYRY